MHAAPRTATRHPERTGRAIGVASSESVDLLTAIESGVAGGWRGGRKGRRTIEQFCDSRRSGPQPRSRPLSQGGRRCAIRHGILEGSPAAVADGRTQPARRHPPEHLQIRIAGLSGRSLDDHQPHAIQSSAQESCKWPKTGTCGHRPPPWGRAPPASPETLLRTRHVQRSPGPCRRWAVSTTP